MKKLIQRDGSIVELRRFEPRHRDAVRFGDPSSARAFLRGFSDHHAALRDVRAFVLQALPEFAPSRLSDTDMLELLARQLVLGHVELVRGDTRKRPGAVGGGVSAGPSAQEPERPDEPEENVPERRVKTWVELQLLGKDDKPIPSVPYWIRLPDGTTRSGNLDAEGVAGFRDLDPGSCDIRWPALDKDAVADKVRATVDKVAPPRPEKTWIEVHLLDGEDRGVPGVPYEITLPDGTLEAANLDGRGLASFHWLDPGECKIVFPSLPGAVSGEPPEARAALPVRTPRPPAIPRKTWLEIELFDAQGPAVGAAYEVKLPDGSLRNGTLGPTGRVRFDDLDPGACEVRWPELDPSVGGDTRKVAAALASQRPRPPAIPRKTWLEIELFDGQGPAAGAAYEVKLPDGSVRNGTLGATGRVRFDDLEPGACEVRWPELDPSVGGDTRKVAQNLEAKPPKRPASFRKSWLEVELFGPDGAAAGAAYEVKLPDGSVRNGTLGPDGRVRFDDLEPGACEVRWPELDRSAGGDARKDAAPLAVKTPRPPAIRRAG